MRLFNRILCSSPLQIAWPLLSLPNRLSASGWNYIQLPGEMERIRDAPSHRAALLRADARHEANDESENVSVRRGKMMSRNQAVGVFWATCWLTLIPCRLVLKAKKETKTLFWIIGLKACPLLLRLDSDFILFLATLSWTFLSLLSSWFRPDIQIALQSRRLERPSGPTANQDSLVPADDVSCGFRSNYSAVLYAWRVWSRRVHLKLV